MRVHTPFWASWTHSRLDRERVWRSAPPDRTEPARRSPPQCPKFVDERAFGDRAWTYTPAGSLRAASCPQAASMSRPRVNRTVAPSPRRSSSSLNAAIAFGLEPLYGESVGLYGIRLTLNIRGSSRSASAAAWA